MLPLPKNKKKGLIIIISAPSGTGKDAISREITRLYPEIVCAITTTTRSPRKGEEEGVNYFFVSEREFERKIRDKEFFEWAKVHGQYYGTPREFIEEEVKKGYDVLLLIDVQGGLSFKSEEEDSILIFVAPPSEEALRSRLRGRGTEDEAAIERRLQTAADEMAYAKFYDYWVINDVLEEAVNEISSIIIAERRKIKRFLSEGETHSEGEEDGA